MDRRKIQKQREAVLKHYGGDVVKTAKLLDLDVELDILREYNGWLVGVADIPRVEA